MSYIPENETSWWLGLEKCSEDKKANSFTKFENELTEEEVESILFSKWFDSFTREEANKATKPNILLFRLLEYPTYKEIDEFIQKTIRLGEYKFELEIIPEYFYGSKHDEFREDRKIFESLGYSVTYNTYVTDKRKIIFVSISWK